MTTQIRLLSTIIRDFSHIRMILLNDQKILKKSESDEPIINNEINEFVDNMIITISDRLDISNASLAALKSEIKTYYVIRATKLGNDRTTYEYTGGYFSDLENAKKIYKEKSYDKITDWRIAIEVVINENLITFEKLDCIETFYPFSGPKSN